MNAAIRIDIGARTALYYSLYIATMDARLLDTRDLPQT